MSSDWLPWALLAGAAIYASTRKSKKAPESVQFERYVEPPQPDPPLVPEYVPKSVVHQGCRDWNYQRYIDDGMRPDIAAHRAASRCDGVVD